MQHVNTTLLSQATESSSRQAHGQKAVPLQSISVLGHHAWSTGARRALPADTSKSSARSRTALVDSPIGREQFLLRHCVIGAAVCPTLIYDADEGAGLNLEQQGYTCLESFLHTHALQACTQTLALYLPRACQHPPAAVPPCPDSTHPTGCPSASTIGSRLILFSSMTSAASCTEAVTGTVMAGEVMCLDTRDFKLPPAFFCLMMSCRREQRHAQ
eukprot:965051-Pelagomonas_calceolata.AAC.2